MTTGLFELIGYIETKNKLQSIRFEPGVYGHIVNAPMNRNASLILDKIQRLHACSRSTAVVIYSSSWGAIQLMGFNLYEGESYNKNVFDFIASIEDQQAAFERFIKLKLLDKLTPDVLASNSDARKQFARTYNGSDEYIKPMLDALKYFGYSII